MEDSTNRHETKGRKSPRVRTRDAKTSTNVIRVHFGNGSAERSSGGSAPVALEPKGGPPLDASASPFDGPGNEAVTALFSRQDVARLLKLTVPQLMSLDRTGVVQPSGRRGGRRAYTFQDLIALRTTQELLQKKVRIRAVAEAVEALRESLPKVTRPLQELRVLCDGRRVIVRSQDGMFEAVSGQMILDFSVENLRKDVVRFLKPDTPTVRARTAYELYCRASTLDENPKTFDEAEGLYAKALELDPSLAIAYTNLGNIRFRRGDDEGAERLYRQALSVDDSQPEAHYNLGYVMLERGDSRRSIPHFCRAIAVDPRFSDAHFNLAMAYERVGDHGRAVPHWRRYLDLEPTGTWADIARDHLK